MTYGDAETEAFVAVGEKQEMGVYVALSLF